MAALPMSAQGSPGISSYASALSRFTPVNTATHEAQNHSFLSSLFRPSLVAREDPPTPAEANVSGSHDRPSGAFPMTGLPSMQLTENTRKRLLGSASPLQVPVSASSSAQRSRVYASPRNITSPGLSSTNNAHAQASRPIDPGQMVEFHISLSPTTTSQSSALTSPVTQSTSRTPVTSASSLSMGVRARSNAQTAIVTHLDDDDEDHEDDDGRSRKRRFAHRAKTGCVTCRRRKKKCDEAKPVCRNCTKGSFVCEGYKEKTIVRPQTESNSRGRQEAHIAARRREQRPPRPAGADSPWYSDPRHETQRGPFDSWSPSSRTWSAGHTPTVSTASGASPLAIRHQSNASAPQSTMPHYRAQSDPKSPLSYANHELSSRMQSSNGYSYRSQQRQKMIDGDPYRPYADPHLIQDRQDCKKALSRFHEATKPLVANQTDSAGPLRAIFYPAQRRDAVGRPGVAGSIGHDTIIETPFACDYGYNLHIGDHVVVMPDCKINDPCRIDIGARTIIGHNVKLRGMTFDHSHEQGHGQNIVAIGETIKIGEDCVIGDDVTISGGVSIGNGSVIEPGSHVTKNVKPGERCGGNPADFICTVRKHKEVSSPISTRERLPAIQEQLLSAVVDGPSASRQERPLGPPAASKQDAPLAPPAPPALQPSRPYEIYERPPPLSRDLLNSHYADWTPSLTPSSNHPSPFTAQEPSQPTQHGLVRSIFAPPLYSQRTRETMEPPTEPRDPSRTPAYYTSSYKSWTEGRKMNDS